MFPQSLTSILYSPCKRTRNLLFCVLVYIFQLRTARNATDLLQVVNFIVLFQLVNKLQQTCQFHQIATSMLKSGLSQLVICRLVETTCSKFFTINLKQIKSVDNLQQICRQQYRLVDNKPFTRYLLQHRVFGGVCSLKVI